MPFLSILLSVCHYCSSGNPDKTSPLSGLDGDTSAFRSAAGNFGKFLSLETCKLDDFILKIGVAELIPSFPFGSKVGFPIGKKEGIFIDQKFRVFDKISLFSISMDFQGELDNELFSVGLRRKFEENGIFLSQDSTVSIMAEGHRWKISDRREGKYYIIEKDGDELYVYEKEKRDDKIKLKKRGFFYVDKVVDNTVDKDKLSYGKLVISWAYIYIDSQKVATTPIDKPMCVGIGIHAIKLENPQTGKVWQEDHDFQKGETYVLPEINLR